MNTKMTIIKWLLIIYFIALLPTPLYIAGNIILFWIFFGSVIGIFKTLLPMPRFGIYFGLLKRQYMINKIRKGTTP